MRARRDPTPPQKDPTVNHALAGQEATLFFNDDLVRQWWQEEDRCCPPRLCAEDLKDPEGFRVRLEAWIRTQC